MSRAEEAASVHKGVKRKKKVAKIMKKETRTFCAAKTAWCGRGHCVQQLEERGLRAVFVYVSRYWKRSAQERVR